MNLADKMGIAITIGIVAAAVGFTMTGGTGTPSDIPTNVAPVIKQSEEIREDLEPAVEKIKEVAEESKEILEETKATAEKGMQVAEELASPKASVRLVSIPEGTAAPGCEKEDLCYDPPQVIVFKDAEIIWKNDDAAAHTVTSGTPLEGPDGKFDSGLILAGNTYSYKFEEKGKYPYFCMVHPWMKGSVSVQ